MLCPGCQAPIESDAVFCGHCGSPLPPAYLRSGVEESVHTQSVERWSDDEETTARGQTHQSSVAPAYPLTPLPASRASGLTPSPAPLPFSARPSLHRPGRKVGTPSTSRNLVFIAVILAILGVGIAAGIFALWQNKHISSSQQSLTTVAPMSLPHLSGVAQFHDTSNDLVGVNSVSLVVQGLEALPNDSHYAAWLVNEHELHIQPLGTLTKTSNGYIVNFSQQSGNLLAVGNTLEVTVETSQTTLPTGRVLLSAHFPPMAGMHINHLLVSYPETPNKVPLLPGLLAQTRQLYTQSQQLRTTHDKTTIQCLAQNILVLLDGQAPQKPVAKAQVCSSAHVAPVTSTYGLLGQHSDGYINTVGAHASLAATQTDSTDNIRMYAQQVIFASENLSNWFSTLHQDAEYLLKHPDDHGKAVEIASLADHTLNGVDSNDNGNIEPIRGEAGAMQAYLSGQSMATLTLTNK